MSMAAEALANDPQGKLFDMPDIDLKEGGYRASTFAAGLSAEDFDKLGDMPVVTFSGTAARGKLVIDNGKATWDLNVTEISLELG